MIDIVWRLTVDTLERENEVRPLIEAVTEAPAFEPVRYDLNQRAKWREFDLDRAVVDALTQRTQLVRIDGSGDGSDTANKTTGTRAIIATGKHDEQPTCMIRIACESEREPELVRAAVDQWDEVCRAVDIDRLHVTGPTIRDWLLGLVGDESEWPESSMPAAYVVGWPTGRPPREWDIRAVDAIPAGTPETADEYPVREERDEVAAIWWSAPGVSPPLDGDHGERVLERLRRVTAS